ncbi:Nn.00g117440.m01.CDS01 [Neocucurbitaria sp. VM-36]
MYKPLDDSKRQIRLLHLLPGDDDTELSCTFSLVSLDDDPEYEAVSYVWGNSEDRRSINVEVVEEPVPITRNLYSVLHSIRLRDHERTLWVDALCINQQDLEERGSQVSIMAAIFRQASRVLAYLGDYWDSCEPAMEVMRQLGGDEDLHFFSHMEHGLNVNGKGLESLELLEGLCNFLDTPWITRVWTVQEWAVAKEVTFLYGKFGISGNRVLASIAEVPKHILTCCRDAWPAIQAHAGVMQRWGERISRWEGLLNMQDQHCDSLSSQKRRISMSL